MSRTAFREIEATLILSDDLSIIDSNDTAAELTGYKTEELLRMRLTDMLDDDSFLKLREFVTASNANDKFSHSGLFNRADNRCIEIELTHRSFTISGSMFLNTTFRAADSGTAKLSLPFLETIQYGRLFETMHEGCAYCRLEIENGKPVDWTYLVVNSAFEKLTGLKNAQEKKASELIPGILERDSALLDIYTKVALTTVSEQFEMYVDSMDMWFSVSAYCPHYGHFVAVFDVITEQKNTEAALQQSESRMRQLVEQAGDTFELLDEEGRYIDVNNTASLQLGYSRQELLTMTVFDINPIINPDRYKAMFLKVFTNGPQTVETMHRRKDGTLFPVEIRLSGFCAGNLYRLSALVRDISQRKELEDRQKRVSESLKLALDASSAGTWDWGIKDNSFYWSPEYFRLFRLPADTEPGFESWLRCLHPDDAEAASARIAEAVENHHQLRSDYRIITPQGEILWIRAIGDTIYENDEPVRMAGLCLDITQLKQDQFEIDLRNELLRLTGSLAKIGGWEFDIFTMNGTWTDEVAAIYDLDISVPPSVALSLGFFLPESRARIEQAISRAIEDKTPYDLELEITSAKGVYKWVKTHGIPIIENGRVVKMRGLFQDITEKKLIGDTLQFLAQKRYDPGQLDLLRDLVGFLSVSYRKACVIIGQIDDNSNSLDTIAVSVNGKPMPNFSIDLSSSPYNKFLNRETCFVQDGFDSVYGSAMLPVSLRFESFLAVPLLSFNGRTIGVIAVADEKPMIDRGRLESILNLVSTTASRELERTRREETLKASEERFKAVTEYSHNAICIINEKAKIIWVNESLIQISGYSREQIFNANSFIDFLAPESVDFVVGNFKLFLLGREYAHHYEFNIIRADGRKRLCEKYMTHFQERDGSRSLAISFIDITDKRQAEEQLVLAKEKALEMNKIRSSFFNNMSHELRTPLIGILGFSELLENQLASDSDAMGMAKTIRLSGYRLLETLNNILTVSKLDAEKVVPRIAGTEMIQLITEIVSLFEPTAKLKGLELSFKTHLPSLNCETDPALMRSILNNLINNAIKYTDYGSVWIHLETRGGKMIISVGDTGIGIARDKIEMIWEEFRQESEGLNRSFQGTGLGLTISRKYTILLNGTIDVSSDLGRGSVFTVTFPCSAAAPAGPDDTVIEELSTSDNQPPLFAQKKSILYVEDDNVSRDFVKRILSNNYDLEYAVTAPQALSLIENRVFDLVLMDINLGQGINGLQLTEMIRKQTRYRAVPFIAVTAFAMNEDRQEFLSKGLDYYISKPFRVGELRSIVEEALKSKK